MKEVVLRRSALEFFPVKLSRPRVFLGCSDRWLQCDEAIAGKGAKRYEQINKKKISNSYPK
jgi:hypothetical protein